MNAADLPDLWVCCSDVQFQRIDGATPAWRTPGNGAVRYVPATRIAALEAELAEALRWKAAVDDAGVVHWTLTKETENDPRKAIGALLDSVSDIALDPAVSSDAAKLRDTYLHRAEKAERDLAAARGAANRIEGDEVLARLRSGNATPEDQYNVANSLAYLWAQDGLLSEAQREVDQLRDQLAEVERPLDEQMARLNANLLAANRARMDAERELKAARAELEGVKIVADQTMNALEKCAAVCAGEAMSKGELIAAMEAARAAFVARKERT